MSYDQNLATAENQLAQLKSTLTHYESALKEARCALNKCVRIIGAVKHAVENNQPVPWLGVCERMKVAKDESDAALATINKVLGEK